MRKDAINKLDEVYVVLTDYHQANGYKLEDIEPLLSLIDELQNKIEDLEGDK